MLHQSGCCCITNREWLFDVMEYSCVVLQVMAVLCMEEGCVMIRIIYRNAANLFLW